MHTASHHKYVLFFILCNALLPFLTVDIHKSIAITPSLVGIVFYVWHWKSNGVRPAFSKETLILTLIILGLSCLSLLWAAHFQVSLEQVTQLCLLLPPQILLFSVVGTIKAEHIMRYKNYLLYGIIAASSLLCIEILSQGLMHNLIRGNPISVPVDPDEFNRGAVAITLYFYAMLALFRGEKYQNWLLGMALCPLIIALMNTSSQAAQLSFIVGAIFLFGFPYRSKATWSILKYGIVTLMLISPFCVSYIYIHYAADLQTIDFMKNGYIGHRLETWDYISRYMMNSPFFGYGIEASRGITDYDSKHIYDASNYTIHPHNFVMQIWIEFGLIGIIIAMGLMHYFISKIQNDFSIQQQKCILPTFMAILVSASTSYGVWQGHWLGLLFHVSAICLLTCKTLELRQSNTTQSFN